MLGHVHSALLFGGFMQTILLTINLTYQVMKQDILYKLSLYQSDVPNHVISYYDT